MADSFLDKAGLEYLWTHINKLINSYLPLTGGTVNGEVNSSAAIATTSAAFRNIKVLTPGTEIIAGSTEIPTGEIWVRYEE